MIIQLNPPIPMTVVGGTVESHTWKGPTGSGLVLFLNDNGQEQHLTWVIVFDDSGQIWEIKNPFVRCPSNLTWGRHTPRPKPLTDDS